MYIWSISFIIPLYKCLSENGHLSQRRAGEFVHILLLLLLFIFVALRPNTDHGLHILEVSRSHTTQHSRQDSSGRVISSSQRPLPDNTQHSQQTNTHAPSGIRIHDLSRRAAQTCALDRAATGTGCVYIYIYIYIYIYMVFVTLNKLCAFTDKHKWYINIKDTVSVIPIKS